MVGSRDKAVEVWLMPVSADLSPPAELLDLLDADELARAGRFRSPDDRSRFIAAHAGLRLLLGTRLGISPADVALIRAPCPLCPERHGRPGVRSDDGIELSMSHTFGMVAYALADRAVGIDIETLDRPASLSDLRAGLHRREERAIALLPAEARRRAALRCWVRKEAYLKGIGTGLGLDPSGVEVGSGSEDDGLAWGPGPDGWSLVDLPAGAAHVAALALAPGAGWRPTINVRPTSLTGLADTCRDRHPPESLGALVSRVVRPGDSRRRDGG